MVVALLGAALMASGCSQAVGVTGGTRTAAQSRTLEPHSFAPASPGVGFPGCGPFPRRRAWAVEVAATGRIAWQTPLPTYGLVSTGAAPPLLTGSVAVFAQDGVVHGLDAANGRLVWAWHGGRVVDGMWRWGGLMAVLTDQVSNQAGITGLDSATGAVRWVLPLPGLGLIGGQVPTGDGGLAVVGSDGVLRVVGLADGRVRWARFAGRSPALAAADGVVLFGMAGQLTGYDARTGQVRWTRSGLPGQGRVLAGQALVTSSGSSEHTGAALVALDPGSGRVVWRFHPVGAVTVLASGPAGLAIATAQRLYLLDPRTGRPFWWASTAVAPGTLPLVTATRVVAAEGGPVGDPVTLVSRDAAAGRQLWARPLATRPGGPQPVLRLAGLVVLQTNAGSRQAAPLLAYDLATGRPAWRADLPTSVQMPPVPVVGGLLIQPADLNYFCG
jgi:outer membrane protein assembly factor BamB